MLVAARFLQGSSSGIVFTVGLALLADTVGRDEVGQWLGFVLSGLSVGLMIAPFLGGIVYAKAGYITVFIMVLGVIAFDFLLRIFMIEKKDAEKYNPAKKTHDPKSVAKYGTISHQRTGCHEQRREASPDHEPHRETNSIGSNRTTGEEDLLISSSSSTVSQHRRISNQNSFFSRRFPAYSSLLGSRRLMAAVYGSFINTTIICAFDGVLPLFVHRTFGWDSIGAGVIFLPITVPALLGPLIGALSDRLGPRMVALGGFALATPSIALLGLVTHNSVEQAVLLCCLLTVAGTSPHFSSMSSPLSTPSPLQLTPSSGFGTNMIFTPLAADMSIVVDALDREESGVFGDAGAYAQAYGLFDGALAAGTVFGPAFAGLMYQQTGWAAAVGTLAAVCVTGTLPVVRISFPPTGWGGGVDRTADSIYGPFDQRPGGGRGVSPLVASSLFPTGDTQFTVDESLHRPLSGMEM